MPKHEILQQAGNPVSKEMQELLKKYFSEKYIQKLEKLGGRVVISLTTPYKVKSKGHKQQIEINEHFINGLYEIRNQPENLEKQLDLLSVKELRILGGRINHPLRTKSSRQELVKELIAYFRGEEVWRQISNVREQ